MSTAVQAMLAGMPEPGDLRRVDVDGQTIVMVGSRVVSCYASDDLGMRNIAVVTLTDLGFAGTRVAQVMGLTQVYVSVLRARARREGSAGLVRVRGRRPKLSQHQVRRARGWRAQGVSDVEIGRRLGVSDKTAARVLTDADAIGEVAAAPAELDLTPDPDPEDEPDTEPQTDAEPVAVAEAKPDVADAEPDVQDAGPDVEVVEVVAVSDVEVAAEPADGWVLGRLSEVVVASRYAGAMLLHAFFHQVGAQRVLAGVLGRGVRHRLDDLAVLVATALGFAVGSGTLEGTKHLIRSQVGPLAGIGVLPELRTLRPRLAALAQAADPLALQRDLARAMIGAQAPIMDLFFVDDHFVTYGGNKPVGMGHNAKRGRAEKGLGDTLVTDYRGRVVAFLSGEPSGLSVTLPKALAELTQLARSTQVSTTTPRIMVGFDRGGSYPKVFTACRSANVDWLTYRRGDLAEVSAAPRRYFYAGVDGVQAAVILADELITLKGYGTCRQITLFEGPPGAEKPVLQVLTSDLSAPAAALLAWLRCRWRGYQEFCVTEVMKASL